MFTIKPYNPEGGDLIFKIPQSNTNQKVNISIDGKLHKEATITTDGKTITMKVSIPSDEHNVIISGAQKWNITTYHLFLCGKENLYKINSDKLTKHIQFIFRIDIYSRITIPMLET